MNKCMCVHTYIMYIICCAFVLMLEHIVAAQEKD